MDRFRINLGESNTDETSMERLDASPETTPAPAHKTLDALDPHDNRARVWSPEETEEIRALYNREIQKPQENISTMFSNKAGVLMDATEIAEMKRMYEQAQADKDRTE